MDIDSITAYLGRPLTDFETANFDSLFNQTVARLENLLGTPLVKFDGDRTFTVRQGFRTIWIDIFTSVTAVKIDDKELSVDEWTAARNDARGALDWFNSIVLSEKPIKREQTATITASWGFDLTNAETLPEDLKILIAACFAAISQQAQFDPTVANEQIEDYRVSFNTAKSPFDLFVATNTLTIQKYSQTKHGDLRNGIVRAFC
jgi:hypothetical protein